jgi:hypothetical protein
MKKLIYLCIGLLFVSCTEKIDLPQNTSTPIVNADKGYLSFSSAESFSDFMKQIKTDTAKISAANLQLESMKNFSSLHKLQLKLVTRKQLMSDLQDPGYDPDVQGSSSSSGSNGTSTDGIEEGTQDEYNLARVEDLITDPDLMSVLDTTLRITIGNVFYKITPDGTFYGDAQNANAVTQCAQNYQNLKYNFTTSDNGVSYYGNVYRFDTFQQTYKTPDYSSTSTTVSSKIQNYNLKSSAFDMSTTLLWSNCSDENNFDDNHRVSFKVYKNNYIFGQTAGCVVKLQKRKKFLGIKYWKCITAENVVLGFNHFKAKYVLQNPMPPLGSQFPIVSNAKTAVTSAISSYTVRSVLTGLGKTEFMRDFLTDSAPFWVADLTGFSLDLSKSISNFSFKSLTTSMRNVGSSTLSTLLRKSFPNDPPQVLQYDFDGKDIQVACVGERSFGSTDNRKIVFNNSFGFKFGVSGENFYIGPCVPTRFNFNKIDIYGAVKYNGRWLGLRFSNL